MNRRIAKKIVKRHENDMAKNTPWQKILQAFRRLGKKAPEAREKVEAVIEKAEEAVEEVQEAVEEVQEATEAVAETWDLTKMKVAELKALAREKGIKGASKMRKADLIEALSREDG